eukprot:TRINITY_DN614_c0_g3_i1.p1 TRINITY_DN614_c0_g3~~TRINITY_DN614_c0_g3_i1.p1  ORF type:complete len:367 (+),score=84.84 TRINITY_DN614_c0_g3_i1:57-1157(+)
MHQPEKYYNCEKRPSSSCYCLIFIGLFVSVASFAAVAIGSSELLCSPFSSLLEKAEIALAFDDFIRDYDRSYSSEEEQQFHKEIFARNYKFIKELNGQYTVSFAVNQFADLTDEEFEEQYLNNKGVAKYTLLQKEIQTNETEPNRDIEIDWVKRGKVTPVKNQGVGISWASAATSIFETIYAIKENKLLYLSEQQAIDCYRKNGECEFPGCERGLVSEILQYAIDKGVMLEKDYTHLVPENVCKYDTSKIIYKPHSFVTIKPGNIQEMEGIVQTRSLIVAVSAIHRVFRFYKEGILEKDCPETPLDHTMAIVGAGTLYGIPYWLAKNSWGHKWGDAGYIRIARTLKDYPTGVCGIASRPEYVKYKD